MSPDFAKAMAVLAAGVDKTMPKEQVLVYYDLLKDIPIPVLKVAVKQALIEHDFHTIPPVGLLRRLAVTVMQGPEMSPDEAWGHVRNARRQYHLALYEPQQWEAVEAKIPEPVRTIARRFGWSNLAEGDEDVVRSNFLKIYAATSHEERRRACIPADVKGEMARLNQEFLRVAASGIRGIE